MGCSDDKQKIEDQIALIKLERMKIQTQKDNELKKLSKMEGKEYKRICVPDYIDPQFAKDNNLAFDTCCIIKKDNKEEDEKQDKSKKNKDDKNKKKGKKKL